MPNLSLIFMPGFKKGTDQILDQPAECAPKTLVKADHAVTIR